MKRFRKPISNMDMLDPLYFLHGMESSPQGTKARFLKQHFPECRVPELLPDIQWRHRVLQELIGEPVWIIGSSLGGLSALLFAMDHPDRVKGMMLLAPAVGYFDPDFFSAADRQRIDRTTIPAGIPCYIIAGEKDEVIPLAAIEALVWRSPEPKAVVLEVVDDDHSLNQSLYLLLDRVQKMISR